MRSWESTIVVGLAAACAVWLGLACDGSTESSDTGGPASTAGPTLCSQLAVECGQAVDEPTLGELMTLVPSGALPDEVTTQNANNNLDVVLHDGRVFLAFRTGPNHFASDEVRLYIVSSTDHETWDFEAEFFLETDLREPRFLSFDGRLLMYFAVLGDEPLAFEPQGSRVIEYLGPGDWSAPEPIFDDTFIPWRARVVDGVPLLIGYTGGGEIYDSEREPLQVQLLTTQDGREWTPYVPGQATVLEGGVSETDFGFLDDGTLVAVARNEAGDEDGFGSKICRAEADELGTWTCASDPKKYDSPLVFVHDNRVFLIGRRNVTETGNYDLGDDDASINDRYSSYQLDYWTNPKRCSLWEVDPEALEISFVLDLPSNGDTCFASLLPLSANDYLVYNYTSPLDGDELTWVQGQTGTTSIYAVVLSLP